MKGNFYKERAAEEIGSPTGKQCLQMTELAQKGTQAFTLQKVQQNRQLLIEKIIIIFI